MRESELRDLLPPERPLPVDRRERMRRALAAHIDADAPPGPPRPPGPPVEDRRARRGGRGRSWLGAAVVAGAAAAVAVGVVVARDGGDAPTSVRSAATTETTAAPVEPRPANGAAPGRAVVIEDVLHTYDDQGRETGTTALSELSEVSSISSDLAGGWVACGEHPDWANADETASGGWFADEADEPPLYLGVSRLVWFPEGGEPVVLRTPVEPDCSAGSVQVVDSPAGPTAVYRSRGYSETELRVMGPAEAAKLGWHAFTLGNGTDTRLPFPLPTGPVWSARPPWAAATGRLLVQDVDGYHLYDLDTLEALPTPPLDVTPKAFGLSPDGTSAATVTVTADQVGELAVYDLATGARTFEQRIDMAGSIVQLSYDGSVAAVASSSDGASGTVTVVDLASGSHHTLDVYGAPA